MSTPPPPSPDVFAPVHPPRALSTAEARITGELAAVAGPELVAQLVGAAVDLDSVTTVGAAELC